MLGFMGFCSAAGCASVSSAVAAAAHACWSQHQHQVGEWLQAAVMGMQLHPCHQNLWLTGHEDSC